MTDSVKDFLISHKIHTSTINPNKLVDEFKDEMIKGLEGRQSSLEMIPTYIEAESAIKKKGRVLAIDAGGTNFRAAIVSFGKNGQIKIGEVVTHTMPGVEYEISAEDFFATMAGYIEHLAANVERIGFCFSYPVEMFPNKDGRLMKFCKEIQAPEVVGKMIGRSLLEALGSSDKEIILLNDTVATLLAGKSASTEKSYKSYVGFILGTGTNTSYIEKNKNILKLKGLNSEKSQIINMETGNFGRAPRSDLDLKFDTTTNNPGEYTFEKMFSGGYFGALCLTVLKKAAEENLFSHRAAEDIKNVHSLSSEQANEFLLNKDRKKNIRKNCFNQELDRETSFHIIDSLIDRASLLMAANLAAVVLKKAEESLGDQSILITVEGTTYYKLHNLKDRFERYFSNILTGRENTKVEFAHIDYSSLTGAAIAAQLN